MKKFVIISIAIIVFFILLLDYNFKKRKFYENLHKITIDQFNTEFIYTVFYNYYLNNNSFPDSITYLEIAKYEGNEFFIDPFDKYNNYYKYLPIKSNGSVKTYYLLSVGFDGKQQIKLTKDIRRENIYEIYKDSLFFSLKSDIDFSYLDQYFGRKDIIISWQVIQ